MLRDPRAPLPLIGTHGCELAHQITGKFCDYALPFIRASGVEGGGNGENCAIDEALFR